MIYLDNSATTRQFPEVTETMIKYMEEYFGNPSSLYQLGVDSEKAIKNGTPPRPRGDGAWGRARLFYFRRNGRR